MAEEPSFAHSALGLTIASLSRHQIMLKRLRAVAEKLSATGICLGHKAMVSRSPGSSSCEPHWNKEDEHQRRK